MPIWIVCKICGYKNPFGIKSYDVKCLGCGRTLLNFSRLGVSKICSKCGLVSKKRLHKSKSSGFYCDNCWKFYRVDFRTIKVSCEKK